MVGTLIWGGMRMCLVFECGSVFFRMLELWGSHRMAQNILSYSGALVSQWNGSCKCNHFVAVSYTLLFTAMQAQSFICFHPGCRQSFNSQSGRTRHYNAKHREPSPDSEPDPAFEFSTYHHLKLNGTCIPPSALLRTELICLKLCRVRVTVNLSRYTLHLHPQSQ